MNERVLTPCACALAYRLSYRINPFDILFTNYRSSEFISTSLMFSGHPLTFVFNHAEPGWLTRYRNQLTGWTNEESLFDSRLGQGIYLFMESSPRYPLYRALGGPQRRSGSYGEKSLTPAMNRTPVSWSSSA